MSFSFMYVVVNLSWNLKYVERFVEMTTELLPKLVLSKETSQRDLK